MNVGEDARQSDPEPAPESSLRGDSIEAIEREFARGNYNLVRRCAKELLRSPDPNVSRFAREILAKTAPDPGFVALIGLAFAFFVGITIYVYAVGG